jgi:hypothetical protein
MPDRHRRRRPLPLSFRRNEALLSTVDRRRRVRHNNERVLSARTGAREPARSEVAYTAELAVDEFVERWRGAGPETFTQGRTPAGSEWIGWTVVSGLMA